MNLFCMNEYAPLRKVFVCSPRFMTFGKVRNVENQEMPKVTIDIDKAMTQHGIFVKKLEENGVEVIYLPAKKEFSEAVFTRDIAFTIGSSLFLAKLAHPPRMGEERNLVDFLNREGISHHDLFDDHIEGGDVLIDGKTIYVGVSNRTHEAAIAHLAKLLPHFEVVSLPFSDRFLHLDCIFNILSSSEALIYPGEFPDEKAALLAERFELIEVSTKEQESLGTNVLSVGHRKVISHLGNTQVNHVLTERGFKVIEVDFSEIIKAGGAMRCCSLPVLRGEE